MPRATSSTNVIATIGIDIGKNTFHVIGLDAKGAIILRHKLSRGQVYARLANIPPLSLPHLDPHILMVESTEHGPHFDAPVALNGPSNGCILP